MEKRRKLERLYMELKRELKVSEKRALESKRNAEEIAKAAANSPSQSGDRTHAEGQAAIYLESYERLRKVLGEVEKALKLPIPERVLPPCFVEIEIEGKKREFYILSEPIGVGKLPVLSMNSPLGKALKGKKVNGSFATPTGLSGKLSRLE